MTTGNTIVILMSLACFGSFAWAVKGHFRIQEAVPPGMRAISVASLTAAAWLLGRLLVGGVVPYWPVAAATLAIAFTLFWWSVRTTRPQRLSLAFDDDVPSFLHRGGPYRWIRHPFYASYVLFWIATSLATPGALSWIVPVGFGATYVAAATKEERKFTASSLAAEYARYRSHTGMLLPLRWWRQEK